MRTAWYTKCDTFLTRYDVVGRKTWERHNYSCSDFLSEYLYEYNDSITRIYRVHNGSKTLSEKAINNANGDSQEMVFFSDSSVVTTVFKGDKIIRKEKFENAKVTERWKYIYYIENGENITTVLKNGKFNYKILEKYW